LEDFKYLVRFPPHKQIANTIISDTTYFKLKKKGVLVLLRAWNGDIDPYDVLEEVWVQIRGVPPQVEQMEDFQTTSLISWENDKD
jgi:hypothetical protein